MYFEVADKSVNFQVEKIRRITYLHTYGGPLDFSIDAAHHRVLVTYRHQPTFLEWEQTMDTIFADPFFRADFGIVLDKTQIRTPPSNEYVGRQVRYIDAKNEKFSSLRWAVVASNSALFGVGRMSEQLVRPDSMRTFYNLNDAIDWLSAGQGSVEAWPLSRVA